MLVAGLAAEVADTAIDSASPVEATTFVVVCVRWGRRPNALELRLRSGGLLWSAAPLCRSELHVMAPVEQQ